MSFLCSCGGRRRKKRGDNSDYYSRTPTPSIAPTPKVKRKFPEGVVPLPSVPSDLEEVVGQVPTVSLGHHNEEEELLFVRQEETPPHESASQQQLITMTVTGRESPSLPPPFIDETETVQSQERPLSACAETQCDFADFDDDLLCFQEEEEYLSQVSELKAKTPSLWDDTSSLKSSDLFDVIQGEVNQFPKAKRNNDEVWKDIKDTLRTLLNDKDSQLVQELRTPMEEIACPNFRVASRDVDVICKHIDDYFAAEGNTKDSVGLPERNKDKTYESQENDRNKSGNVSADVGKHFSFEDAHLRLHENNIGNHLYDNFQVHIGILMPEAKPRSTLSRQGMEQDELNFTTAEHTVPVPEIFCGADDENHKSLNDLFARSVESPLEVDLPSYGISTALQDTKQCVTDIKTSEKNCDEQVKLEVTELCTSNNLLCNESARKSEDAENTTHLNELSKSFKLPTITLNAKSSEFFQNSPADMSDSNILDDEDLNKEIDEFLEVDDICSTSLSDATSDKEFKQLLELENIGLTILDDETLNKEVNEFLEDKVPCIAGDNNNIIPVVIAKQAEQFDDDISCHQINDFIEIDKGHSSGEIPFDENANELVDVENSDLDALNGNYFNKNTNELDKCNKECSGILDCPVFNDGGEIMLDRNSLPIPDVVQSSFKNFSSKRNVDNLYGEVPGTNPFISEGYGTNFNETSKYLSGGCVPYLLGTGVNKCEPFSQDICGDVGESWFTTQDETVSHKDINPLLLEECESVSRPSGGITEEESRCDDPSLPRDVATSFEHEDDEGWKEIGRDKRSVQESSETALDLAQNSNVQDAFVIAVEQQARERLERLSALKRIKPVDMTKLSQQLNQQIPATEQQQELNGFIESSPIYVTSIPPSSVNSATVEQPLAAHRRRGGAGVAVKVTPGAGGGSTTTNGHASSVEEPDSAAEIELKQELEEEEQQQQQQQEQQEPAEVLPSGSPFANGRTEVLIGQDEPAGRLRTTAIVETSDERPRRRSGSSIVVVEAGGAQDKPTADDDIMMMTLENGPHREMAVDVPDSFIARSKTPPRYPPPRPQGLNGSATAPKPVPPPRDHLRIERDGRLVNRAPAPQVPARTVINNNNNNNNNSEREPTKEQLDSIRKFQEALRKRKEEEERVAQQNEFLNRSLRGSRKLQALESHPPPSGVVNDGYSSADEEQLRHRETLRTVIGYGELVASLQRLQLQLKKSSLGQGGYSSLEGQLAAVQTLLLSPQFGRALAVHNKVQQVWNGRVPPPASSHAQSLVRDCLDALQPCSLAGAAELADLLTRYEIEGLLQAHDAIAAASAASGITMGSPVEEESPAQLPGGENIRIIKIEKTNEPLGATVRNEGDAVIIGRIVRGGAAEKSGLLHEGDEVLEVNGIEMRCKSVNEVCDILSGMTGTLTFLIVPKSAARPAPPSPRDTLLHMKAHFDYDPEEDLYIPCRELGISFQKGDVLHVISQEDPNWWQAYREGEEDQTLAGLIPSRSFQHQRESMKQTIAGDKLTREKTKKAGTLLCAKKNPKKKKKKLPYNDGGYPLYATSTIDDYDADEILTYEEVALYYPRANHKRPIVLIGPPNIGRHELRQRLMEDAERFAAAIPHTSRARKDGEVDGQDYHFITRAQFESDILARKFVEHGEYEKAYYGTSLDAIRSVVNSGKICVLNLHPQSLKILRGSDLKPYVVFVAPPSLEKLRQKKIRNGEAYKEDELKDIIEKAREMEDKYGHYFDMIIINNDTDRAYHQLLNEINGLEREPQWVPASWVKAT